MRVIEEYMDENMYAKAWETDNMPSLEELAEMHSEVPSEVKEALDRECAEREIKQEEINGGKFITEFIVTYIVGRERNERN